MAPEPTTGVKKQKTVSITRIQHIFGNVNQLVEDLRSSLGLPAASVRVEVLDDRRGVVDVYANVDTKVKEYFVAQGF